MRLIYKTTPLLLIMSLLMAVFSLPFAQAESSVKAVTYIADKYPLSFVASTNSILNNKEKLVVMTTPSKKKVSAKPVKPAKTIKPTVKPKSTAAMKLPTMKKPTVTPRVTKKPIEEDDISQVNDEPEYEFDTTISTKRPTVNKSNTLPVVYNPITLYYKKTNANRYPIVHVQPLNLSWQLMPGVTMHDSNYPGYAVITLNASVWEKLEAIVYDGKWVTNEGERYQLTKGEFTIDNGILYEGKPLVEEMIPIVTATPTPTPTPTPKITITPTIQVTMEPIITFTPIITEEPVMTPSPTPEDNKITIYYKRGYATPYLYYRPTGGSWPKAPGTLMLPADDRYPGYSYLTVSIGKASTAEIAFNNGAGIWDSRGGANYQVDKGITTVSMGVKEAGLPKGFGNESTNADSTTSTFNPLNPSTPDPTNFVTVYYRPTFSGSPYIYHRIDANAWPSNGIGVIMQASEVNGYFKYTFTLGNGKMSEMAFSNGTNVWDSRNKLNYKLIKGTYYINGGEIFDGVPKAIASTEQPNTPSVALPQNPNSPTQPTPTETQKPSITAGPAQNESLKIYYKKTWNTNYIHYCINTGKGCPPTDWTPGVGVLMRDSEVSGYVVHSLNIPAGAKLHAVFNNGLGSWDNNQSLDYRFSAGIAHVRDGRIYNGVPVIPTLAPIQKSNAFSWDNATVYFAITDRFYDGDPSNNHSYGRETNENGVPNPDFKNQPGSFHGGDLKGLIQKMNEGYFTKLGVNAIWITAPYEQIHGWLGGGDPAKNEGFKHYAYHGYWVLDYTEVDQNMGSKEDLKQFIDLAHSQGIRIVFDVVMNHAGYATMKDMDEFKYGILIDGWKNYYYNTPWQQAFYENYNKFIVQNDKSERWNQYSWLAQNSWSKFWGPQWVRANIAGYSVPGHWSDDLTRDLDGLSDFRTESKEEVGLPQILLTKWGASKTAVEQAELDAFFKRSGKAKTPRNYIVKWLTDWVREYGIDGFRIDTAKNVELDAWKVLKEESVIALREWKAANPSKKVDDSDFWMVAEAYGHTFVKSEYFTKGGFDAVINFDFRKSVESLTPYNSVLNTDKLDQMFAEYAGKLNNDDTFNVLNYLSSHDDAMFDRKNLYNAGVALILSPGASQIFYGDESARNPINAPWNQGLRSDMNWSYMDNSLLQHWQKLGQFRKNHIAIGAGSHQKLNSSPYTFLRKYEKDGINDRVIVVLQASGEMTIDVSSAFDNGVVVRDAYTGRTAKVTNGKVTLQADSKGVMLLEVYDASNDFIVNIGM